MSWSDEERRPDGRSGISPAIAPKVAAAESSEGRLALGPDRLVRQSSRLNHLLGCFKRNPRLRARTMQDDSPRFEHGA